MKREQHSMNMETFFRNLVTSYAFIILVTYLLVTFVAQPFTIYGTSMYPTLKNGDLVIVSKISLFSRSSVRTGDIIAFFAPVADADVLIKRVSDREEAPDNKYFVLGDNIEHSIDSRQFGRIAEGKIIGKAVLILWPPGDFGTLKDSPTCPD
jgi:signal peptidase I